MKLWMSGEIQDDISETYGKVSNRIEDVLNPVLQSHNYGDGLLEWDVIAIILDEPASKHYKEIKKYDRRKRSSEFRLAINHSSFKSADAKQQFGLVIDMLLRSLSILEDQKVPNLNISALRSDVMNIARQNHWLK